MRAGAHCTSLKTSRKRRYAPKCNYKNNNNNNKLRAREIKERVARCLVYQSHAVRGMCTEQKRKPDRSDNLKTQVES